MYIFAFDLESKKKHCCMKKRLLLLLVMTMLVMTVYAQYGLRFKATYQTNFKSTMVNVVKYPEGKVPTCKMSNFPSFGGMISGGWSFEKIYLDLNFATSYDEFYYDNDLFNNRHDYVTYVTVGYKCLKSKMVALDLLTGLGVGVSRMRFQYPGLEYRARLAANTLVMPFSAVVWFGNSQTEHGRFGISFEYMLPLLMMGHSITSGLEFADNRMRVSDYSPNTMSVGLKVQF